ncbi:MAG: hypothetical protein EP305_02420 [Bacteroidetes bacterium]|nr:MAG: hypothetical protein EP305_02420 [Bacteroidota bacterium]
MRKQIMVLGAFMGITAFSHAQKEVNVLPAFKSEKEKTEWIKSHPEEYRRMSGQKEELNFSSPEEKQKFIESRKVEKGKEVQQSPAAEHEIQLISNDSDKLKNQEREKLEKTRQLEELQRNTKTEKEKTELLNSSKN